MLSFTRYHSNPGQDTDQKLIILFLLLLGHNSVADVDSDDLDGSADEKNGLDDLYDEEEDLPSGSVTPSLPLKRRELSPDHAVVTKKAPSKSAKGKGKAVQKVSSDVSSPSPPSPFSPLPPLVFHLSRSGI